MENADPTVSGFDFETHFTLHDFLEKCGPIIKHNFMRVQMIYASAIIKASLLGNSITNYPLRMEN